MYIVGRRFQIGEILDAARMQGLAQHAHMRLKPLGRHWRRPGRYRAHQRLHGDGIECQKCHDNREQQLEEDRLHPASKRAACGYLMTSTLLRSMVMATAATRMKPKTICWAKTDMPMKVIPMRTTCTMSAPTKVRQIEPTPPVMAVPPTTMAAMAGSRNSPAKVGEPEPRRAAMTMPAMPAIVPESVKARI